MFGIGMTELLVIFVIGLLVLGPKRLPELARSLGKGLAEFRRASMDMRKEFMDVAEEVVRPMQPAQGVIDRDGLLLGYAGVYGSFLLHAKRAAERFGVDSKDILLELGRRKVVGGQEDMIIDVAVELERRAADAMAQQIQDH